MDRELIEAAKESVLWTSFRLQMTIPSILAEGETFALRMTIFGPDAMPASAYERDILFESAPGIEGLPARVRFPVDGSGQFEVPGLRATGVGSTHILARPEGCPSAVASNPAWVEPEPSYRLYWGDLHVHTVYSNCSPWACKDPEFCYAYARDLTHLDFAAAADHLRGIHAEPERWPRLQQLARAYNTPGRFVSFLAFESSHKTGFGGDNNVYFLEDDAPYFWAEREDMLGVSPEVTLPQLWEFLDKTSRHYFTAPHHTGRAGKYRTLAATPTTAPGSPSSRYTPAGAPRKAAGTVIPYMRETRTNRPISRTPSGPVAVTESSDPAMTIGHCPAMNRVRPRPRARSAHRGTSTMGWPPCAPANSHVKACGAD